MPPIPWLGSKLEFPSPRDFDPDGLLAFGGDLRPERLILAYRMGIFPWFGHHEPIMWWSPDPRAVLLPERLHVPRRLEKTLRQSRFRFTADADFPAVIRACAKVPREHERGTWITPKMRRAYTALHRRGLAHSIEVWREDALAGGIYGVSLGRCFFGESMFSVERDASKGALVTLVRQIARWDFAMLDCQLPTNHLKQFGTATMSRDAFLDLLEATVQPPDRTGNWELDADLSNPGRD